MAVLLDLIQPYIETIFDHIIQGFKLPNKIFYGPAAEAGKIVLDESGYFCNMVKL
ncbi:MAG: hypothetical protein ACQETG_04025 [Thermodesulfobacteriota bacterium]